MNILWTASYIALWVIVCGLAVIVLGLLRQLGLINLRVGLDPGALITPDGLPRGTKAPDFEALDIRAEHLVRLSRFFFRERRVVLVFLTTSCSTCRDLVPHLNDLMRERQREVTVLVVCHGEETTCREFVRQVNLQPTLLVDPGNAVAMQYDVQVNPFAFLIDASGTILIRGVVNTWLQLEALLDEEGTVQTNAWHPAAAEPANGATSPHDGGGEKVALRSSGVSQAATPRDN